MTSNNLQTVYNAARNGYSIKHVSGDGACFFYAIMVALDFSDLDNTGHIRLRNDVRYIRQNMSLFIDFYQNATMQNQQAQETVIFLFMVTNQHLAILISSSKSFTSKKSSFNTHITQSLDSLTH